jgi:Viral coat protein P2 N-terminal domain
MYQNRLPDFNPVAAGQTALLKVPKYAATLQKITLRFGGTTMTKALIEYVRLKLGTKTLVAFETFGAVAGGTILDRVNRVMGIFDDANRLTISLIDQFQEIGPLKELGGWDLSKFSDDVYLEVKIAPTAVAPTMYANGYFTPPQGATPQDPTGQLVTKYISMPYSFSGAGRFSLPFEPKGALIKRLHMQYTGAAGTATTNANVRQFDIKKNGGIIWELEDQENRFFLLENRRVPQAQQYTLDLTADNNMSGALVTADARALEFNPYLNATDTGLVIFECIDAPYNLSN